MGFVERTWTSSDGLRLAARDYAAAGGGPVRTPVVCLHGLTRNARDFEDLAPVLAGDGRRVIAPDVRGRGRSDHSPDPGAYVLPTYVRDAVEMCAALGIARAAFIGTSMGGLIVLALAAAAPALVAAAVLNDVGPEVAPEGLRRIAANLETPVEPRTWAEAADYAAEANRVAFPAYGQPAWDAFARRLFHEDAAGRAVLDYDPAIAEPLRAAHAPAPDLWPLFVGLAQGRPLMVVRGAHSDVLTSATLARMQAEAPGLEVVQAAGVGHAPALDEPDVLPALRAFLARMP